ncbi:MAG: acetyl/propionyl/methylcrotonyl-CoA carboxylase subunit alpha [Rhodospirillaceae bacterium]|nr:acetyl/propionyl/methylcrotonyl-CoA carboxylase subunit alpha [Rhodospirillaceae bacterium]
MFEKILIANRGEIACRVIRTARRMGIATVAVYSEADAHALHVHMADEAVPIGPAPSAESYLRIEAIVEAARATGAQAVHPGYGFLSENRAFTDALAKAEIAFIGPPAGAIAAMGDKIESKRLAAKAGVSTVPGYDGAVADAAEAKKVAEEVGFPVMLKASAGGGGKGMRVVGRAEDVAEGFRAAASEAKSSFGDDRVFVEKFIEDPRHIEIQVLADSQGNTIYLGERECSIQRRHQKVIEEAPSPFLDDATRAAMGEQACALARAVGYVSAGTVEFISDQQRNFYFLEMNTRLQVEHPVTEMVTGLDLVEQMIRIAAGESLPLTQDQVRLDGWAIEARVYAEDPFRGFLPSIGRLVRYREPAARDGVRIDSGVREGGEISMFYDPMIAKAIAHGRDRDEAAARLRRALDAFEIVGPQHNISFLTALLAHPRFGEGRLSTDFIAEEYPEGFQGQPADGEESRRLAAVAAFVHRRTVERISAIGGQVPGHEASAGTDWVVRSGERAWTAMLEPVEGGFDVAIDGVRLALRSEWRPGRSLFEGNVDGCDLAVQVRGAGVGYALIHGGAEFDATVLRPRVAELAALMPVKEAPDMSRFLLSPMPGLLLALKVEEGQAVRAGEELAVVEAMKMENVLRAERDGVVATCHAAAGDSLAADQPILEFE